MAEPLKNIDIAEKLQIDPVSVSRLRSGDRRPSTNMMLRIRDELGWSITKQTEAYGNNEYAEKFRDFLETKYGIPQ